MRSKITQAVQFFGGATHKDELRRCLEEDRDEFQRCALDLIDGADGRPGYRYLVYLMLSNGMLADLLFDPRRMPIQDAIALARAVARTGALIGNEFSPILKSNLAAPNDPRSPQRILRMLQVLSALAWTETIMLHRQELLSHTDPDVKSKASFVIAQVTKDPAWVMRTLADGDPRVQANAVQALWGVDNPQCRPVFLAAADSEHNRVAGNGLIGLYRLADVRSIARLLEMADHENPGRRRTAYWAMGETEDPRFLDYLTAEHSWSPPKERASILRALVRIRRRRQLYADAGSIRILMRSHGSADDHGTLAISLSSEGCAELAGLSPMHFALWQADSLVTDYTVSGTTNPAALVAGFIVPHAATPDRQSAVIERTLIDCLALKRPGDLWRVQRYETGSGDPQSAASPLTGQQIALLEEAKKHRGFLADRDIIRTAIHDAPAGYAYSRDLITALDYVVQSSARIGGDHHVFVYFDPGSARDGFTESLMRNITDGLRNANVTLHGIVPTGDQACPLAQRICAAARSSELLVVPVDRVRDASIDSYQKIFNRYDIAFNGCHDADRLTVQVYSDAGFGEVSFLAATRHHEAA